MPVAVPVREITSQFLKPFFTFVPPPSSGTVGGKTDSEFYLRHAVLAQESSPFPFSHLNDACRQAYGSDTSFRGSGGWEVTPAKMQQTCCSAFR